MDKTTRLHVLCVDDEPNVLEGLALHLRRQFQVASATSAVAGLEILKRDVPIAVIISDMRMPGMNGAEFLKAARELNPDAVRMLLTGQTDLDSAIAAVNEGRIFRFLTKPCPPATLLASVAAAAEQHRLISAERILLEQTLRGSLKTLIDVLALTNPVSFGRANRVKQLAIDLAGNLGIKDRWQLEIAAMLSQLGYIILPPDVAEKAYFGSPLSEAEQKMVDRIPSVTEQLLCNIPRLELIREVLAHCANPAQNKAPLEIAVRVADLAQVLLAALDFDLLEAQGNSTSIAVQTMRGRAQRYKPAVLDALAALRGSEDNGVAVREVTITGLRVGMIFAGDVKMMTGALVVARGYEITESFLERIRNFRPGTLKEPLKVAVPARVEDTTASAA
jgi:CheY-like chemotaxis protein